MKKAGKASKNNGIPLNFNGKSWKSK